MARGASWSATTPRDAMDDSYRHTELFASMVDQGSWGESEYIGAAPNERDADPLYFRFAAMYKDPSIIMTDPVGDDGQADFEAHFADLTLDTEDAPAVYAQAQAHHACATLAEGPLRGLPQWVGAREVAAAVAEQLEALEHSAARGLRGEGLRAARAALGARGLRARGVEDGLRDRLQELEEERNTFAAMLDQENLSAQTSSLIDSETIKLYCSFFTEEALEQEEKQSGNYDSLYPSRIDQRKVTTEQEYKALVEQLVEENFVRKELDLYVRKTNEYMLFNKVGAYAAAKSAIQYYGAPYQQKASS